MLSAFNADMKAYWGNDVFAKVYSLFCELTWFHRIHVNTPFDVEYLFEFLGIYNSCWLIYP